MLFAGPARIPVVSSHRRLELNLTRPQSRIFMSKMRHRALVTGRRFGKTTLLLGELEVSAAKYPWSENWYVGPTWDQAKDIAWEALYTSLEPTGMIRKSSQSKLWVELKNRSIIALKSGEAYDRMRGKGNLRPIKMVAFDEMRHIPIEAVEQVVRPMLGDVKMQDMYGELGRLLIAGTPGGFDHFKKLFDDAAIKDDWEAFQFTSIQGGNIGIAEIEQMRKDLTERDLRQELEASFEALTGLCYHAFAHKLNPLGNLDPSIANDPDLPLLVGMDFNVSPMTATISQRRIVDQVAECHTFDEFSIMNSNTTEMTQAINERYPKQKKIVFPDPHSAGNRSTSAPAGQTDLTLLRAAGFEVFIPPSKFYAIRDRYNTTNGMLRNANGLRRLKVHPRCKELIRCFNGLTYKEGTNEPDKTLNIEHIGDAEGYMIMGAFPAGIYNSSIKELRL